MINDVLRDRSINSYNLWYVYDDKLHESSNPWLCASSIARNKEELNRLEDMTELSTRIMELNHSLAPVGSKRFAPKFQTWGLRSTLYRSKPGAINILAITISHRDPAWREPETHENGKGLLGIFSSHVQSHRKKSEVDLRTKVFS